MSLLSDWRERLRGVFLKRRSERELDAELRFHVDQEAAHRIREGADPQEARRAALVAFGGVEQTKEDVRDARGTRGFEELLADIRYAVRNLGKHPVFTAAAVIVLGLGLGAGTTVYAVVDAVLLAKLPHPESDRLVRIYQQNPSNRWAVSTVDAQAIVAEQRSFDAVGVMRVVPSGVSGPSGPDQLMVGWATAGVFDALRTTVAVGRSIRTADEAPGAPPVALVTDAMARQRWGDPARAVGQALTVDGTSHEVVGVFPSGVNELAGVRAEVWTALRLEAPSRRGPFWLRGIGRLKPDATLESATRDLAGISERIFPLWAAGFRDQTARLTPVPLLTTIVGDAGQQVNLFAAAVGLVLLVAIANVATLMLVRASGRSQEFGVRLALGAGKGRLARMLVTDSVILTLAAGLFGLMVAVVGVRLVTEHATDLPRVHDVALNLRSLGFLFTVALVSGLAVGGPAVLAALAGRAGTSLRIDSRRTGTDRRTGRIRSALVVAEFALALPLLVGAGLLLQSLMELRRVNPGFDPEGVVTATVSLPSSRYGDYPSLQTFWRQFEQRSQELPGIAAAGMTLSLPPDESDESNNFDLLDKPVPAGGTEHTAPWTWVTPGYFAAIGVPLLEGRMFAPTDSGLGLPVVVV
ncbi:MAG: ABC transporter permease, partial [Gemmatimonadales bacterium]